MSTSPGKTSTFSSICSFLVKSTLVLMSLKSWGRITKVEYIAPLKDSQGSAYLVCPTCTPGVPSMPFRKVSALNCSASIVWSMVLLLMS